MAGPIRSMTGFGAATHEAGDLAVSVEIRSVNHRYLKVTSRIPDDLPWIQEVVDARVRERAGRGSIQLALQVQRATDAGRYELDLDLVRQLHRQAVELGQEIDPDGELHLRDLLRIDGVVRPARHQEDDQEAVIAVVDQAVEQALEKLQSMQLREGSHLVDEMTRILVEISACVQQLEDRLPTITADNRKRYLARLEEFLGDAGVDVAAGDVLREVAILVEKSDITEEVGRLRGHVDHYKECIETGGRVGRKLDFLTQEMLREANTTAAKVNQLELSTVVVELKTEIDRLREQTQNIE
ncbi:MAG: YicC/YloC family endoribonuclease [Planctomycetota bacterium]